MIWYCKHFKKPFKKDFHYFFLLLRYIQAATSPKDIIIAVDISGSMKGLRLTIAKHTINTILDTLGENDFVNVIAVRTEILYTVS